MCFRGACVATRSETLDFSACSDAVAAFPISFANGLEDFVRASSRSASSSKFDLGRTAVLANDYENDLKTEE